MLEKSVLLVFPPSDWGQTERFCQPLGILTLGAILNDAGIKVNVLDISAEGWSKKRLTEYLEENSFSHIGISVLTLNRSVAYEIFEIAKTIAPEIICIAGGPHVTFINEDIFEECAYIDIAVSGEAESKIVEIIENPTSKFYDLGVAKELDKLPFPERKFVRHIKYNKMSGMWVGDSASMKWIRGCSWRKCTFCSRSEITMIHRRRSPESIIEEIEVIQKKLKYKNIFVVDDSLKIDSECTKEILRLKIKKGLDIPFWALARADHIDEEGAALLNQANCRGLLLGVESIVPRMIDKYQKIDIKPENWQKILTEAFGILNRNNVFAIGTFIVGGPTETKEEILATTNFLKKSKIDVAEAFPFQYVIGSVLWDNAVKDGSISKEQFCSYNDSKFGTSNLTTKEIFKLAKKTENIINSPFRNPKRYVRIARKFIKNKQWDMMTANLLRLPVLIKNFLFQHPYEVIPEDLHG
ncbi:MAG: B12-binding domain-containing radical SAM protein [Candidatus Heimdallarchaeaceae archaeon]